MRVASLRVVTLMALAFLVVNVTYWRANPVSYAYNPNNLIRLHVIANSDSGADIALKDEIAALIREEMALILGDQDERRPPDERAAGVWEMLHRETARLERALAGALDAARAPYGGRLELGIYAFPARSYGGDAVPAGMYRAVRVTLGEASGGNWWCILFPPLCLVDPAAGPVDARPDSGPDVILSEADADDGQLEVRWALLDLLRGLEGMVSSIRDGVLGLVRREPVNEGRAP